MRQPWTCARCDRPILKGQPFTTAIFPGRSPHPGVVSGWLRGPDCDLWKRPLAFESLLSY
jgi:hypothetical protein